MIFIPTSPENVKNVFGFAIKKGTNVNEDLLEELSIHHPNAEVDTDGNVTVYHRTTSDNAEKIYKTGIMTAKEDALFFSSKDSGYATDYGNTVVKLKITTQGTVLCVVRIYLQYRNLPLYYLHCIFI